MQIILAGRFRKLSLKKTVYALHLKVARYEENLSQLKVRRTIGLFHIWCIREYWLLVTPSIRSVLLAGYALNEMWNNASPRQM